MKQTLHLNEDTGLVLLKDAGLAVPREMLVEADRRAVRALAEAGSVFYLDSEDPCALRVAIYLGEGEPDDLPRHRFARNGGTFGLAVPSGRLEVSGGHGFDVVPGRHAVSVYSAELVDAAALQSENEALVGAEDWRFRQRVDRIALLGCLPVVAALAVILFARLSKASLVAAAVAVIALLPGQLLVRTRRYRRCEEKLKANDASYPNHAIHVRPVSDGAGLAGGHLVI